MMSVRWVFIVSDDGLPHIGTNALLSLIWPLGTNISEIRNKIQNNSLKKKHLKMLSVIMAAILSRPGSVKYAHQAPVLLL